MNNPYANTYPFPRIQERDGKCFVAFADVAIPTPPNKAVKRCAALVRLGTRQKRKQFNADVSAAYLACALVLAGGAR